LPCSGIEGAWEGCGVFVTAWRDLHKKIERKVLDKFLLKRTIEPKRRFAGSCRGANQEYDRIFVVRAYDSRCR